MCMGHRKDERGPQWGSHTHALSCHDIPVCLAVSSGDSGVLSSRCWSEEAEGKPSACSLAPGTANPSLTTSAQEWNRLQCNGLHYPASSIGSGMPFPLSPARGHTPQNEKKTCCDQNLGATRLAALGSVPGVGEA